MTSIFAEVGGTRQIYLLKKVKMVTLFLLTELNFGHKTSCAMGPCWSSGFPCCALILGALLQCVHWNSNSKMKALLYMEHLGTDLIIKGTSVITKETSEGLCIPHVKTPIRGAVSVQVKSQRLKTPKALYHSLRFQPFFLRIKFMLPASHL